jgi:hypothetical protein
MTVTVTKPQATLRELLASLKKRTGLFGEQVMRSETATDFYAVVGDNRNLVINGDFRISQRGNYTTATSLANSAYQLDRWKAELSGVTANIQQLSDGNHPNKSGCTYVRTVATSTAASSYMGFYQLLEDSLFLGLRGQTVTLSLWVRSNNSKVQAMIYFGSDFKQVKVAGNGGWQFIKTTLTIPNTNTHTTPYVEILLYDGGGVQINSGDYLEIADVQLELGTAATPFERRSYGQELALCQRYYERVPFVSTAYYNGSNGCSYIIPMKVTKRASPSASLLGTDWGGWATNFGGTFNLGVQDASTVYVNPVGTTSGFIRFADTAIISAEL